jgi:hypothetical protein
LDLKRSGLVGPEAAVAAALREPLMLASARRESIRPLVDAADEHGVAGLLLHRAARAGLSLGAEWASLRHSAAAQAAAAELRDNESLRVLRLIASAGLPAIVLKGLALAHTVYVHAWMRPRGDTDLLIRQIDVPHFDRVFRDSGYTLLPHVRGELTLPQRHYYRDAVSGFRHSWDLHWRLTTSEALREALPEGELWAHAEPRPDLDGARVPKYAEALVLACIHRLAHHFDDPRLIWLWDIRLLLEAMDGRETERFFRLAARAPSAAACGRSLAMARERCGAPVPGLLLPIVDMANPGAPVAFLWSGSRRRISYLIGELRAAAPARRARILHERLLPSLSSMRERYPSVPRTLLPFAYAWRLMAGIPKWLKAEPLRRS